MLETEQAVPKVWTDFYTDVGNRDYQQDAVYVSPSGKMAGNRHARSLGIVCDGMGGMADGGRASATALQMITKAFQRIEMEKEVNIPLFFCQGILATDRAIHDFPMENGRGSGTTMVAAIIEDDSFYWASVGDSRIYLLRGNRLQQLTRDHNYDLRLRQFLKEGMISVEDYQRNRQKEALISFLGIGDISLMDISPSPIPLNLGDMLLLCSDGVTKTLSDDQILQILTSEEYEKNNLAKQIVDAAIHENTKSQDNTSVVLMQYQI